MHQRLVSCKVFMLAQRVSSDLPVVAGATLQILGTAFVEPTRTYARDSTLFFCLFCETIFCTNGLCSSQFFGTDAPACNLSLTTQYMIIVHK